MHASHSPHLLSAPLQGGPRYFLHHQNEHTFKNHTILLFYHFHSSNQDKLCHLVINMIFNSNFINNYTQMGWTTKIHTVIVSIIFKTCAS